MAAGLGFKTFTTGEVLTAADVNGYLMQGVLVFASAAARNAAITSPQEGQFAFTKDTNGLWYYDGAAWVASGATGDIEGVTAGVGITGGGTSGTVTITNDMATTITAAGDIVVGTGSGTYDNLPIGTTAQVLTADTTVSPYKVKWATPASGSTFVGAGCMLGTSITTSNTTDTAITFSSELYDTDSIHSTSSNTSRFTVPTGKGGYWLVCFNATFAYVNTTGYRQIRLAKNGSITGSEPAPAMPANAGEETLGAAMVLSLSAGDYIEMYTWQNSGGNLNIRGTDSGNGRTFMSFNYLGA